MCSESKLLLLLLLLVGLTGAVMLSDADSWMRRKVSCRVLPEGKRRELLVVMPTFSRVRAIHTNARKHVID